MNPVRSMLSVIIPVFNGERFVAEALRSVAGQSHRPLEIVVVDDGSTDGSAGLLDALSREIDFIRVRQTNQGVASARNTGVARSTGELISVLDQDDVWMPGAAAALADHLAAHPEADLVTGLTEVFVDAGEADWRAPTRNLQQGTAVHNLLGATLVRRTALDRVGAFDASFQVADDMHWFMRAQQAGARRAFAPDVVLRHRLHAANQSADTPKSQAELLRALKSVVDAKRAQAARPAVSVIIPVFNGAQYLAEAIDSALGQTRPPDEIVVVDDGSTDGSADIALRRGPPVRLVQQANAGLSAARNRGVREATGDILAFLDADDLWIARKLERQLDVFARAPELDAVSGWMAQFASPELPEAERAQLTGDGVTSPAPFAGTLLVRRAAFDRVGEFDTRLVVGEYLDWHARAVHAGLKMETLDEIVLRRRLHGANMTRRLRDTRGDYVRLLKAKLDRERALRQPGDGAAPGTRTDATA